jgi:hypothetical protein
VVVVRRVNPQVLATEQVVLALLVKVMRVEIPTTTMALTAKVVAVVVVQEQLVALVIVQR